MTFGIVLTALIALTVKVSGPRPRAPAPVVEEDAPPAISREPEPPVPRRAAARQVRRAGPSHLFGRVLLPPGDDRGFDGLTVTADDGARASEARVFPDGRFDLHLPAGLYAVEASLAGLVGIAPVVAVRADADRELTLALAPSVSLRGTVHAPGDAVTIGVHFSLTGRNDWSRSGSPEDGTFDVAGLTPGRSYDLSFEGEGLRRTILRSVTAPADGLEARLDALPILRGAIGFPAGEHCSFTAVALRDRGAAPFDAPDGAGVLPPERFGNVDDACRFHLTVPDGSSQMILVAVGDGRPLEQPVSIPLTGDPDPICVNPPCRANPLDGLATVRVSLENAPPGSGIYASVEPATGETSNLYGCASDGPSCEIEALDPGLAVRVEAGGGDCAQQTTTLVLAAGDNAVTIPCGQRSHLKIIDGEITVE